MRIFGVMWVQNWAQLQGVPKDEGHVRRLDFWTTLGHPGYLEPIRQIWVIWGKFGPFGSFGAKNIVFQHNPQNSLCNFFLGQLV